MLSMDELVKKSIDLHVHVGPEVIPRKYTAQSLAKSEAGKIRGIVLKNHFYPTAGMFEVSGIKGIRLFGSCVLNNAAGGMNPEAVYAASLVSSSPLVVWFPTINSKQFLDKNKYEIAPEWVDDKSIRLKSADEAKPVLITDENGLLAETKSVIKTIAEIKGVLATGHISSQESVLVARYARELDVPVIVTHPIYQHIDMPIEVQKELADIGCYLEQSYSMYSMDSIPIDKIAEQIKFVGPRSVILSSDVGQTFSPSPSVALKKFGELLLGQGVSMSDLKLMLVRNPARILGMA